MAMYSRNGYTPIQTTSSPSPPPGNVGVADVTTTTDADILVAGSVAVDLSCDYAGAGASNVTPKAHTSNPAVISQSIGGVGHNVALAAHRASRLNKVKLCSLVGDDV